MSFGATQSLSSLFKGDESQTIESISNALEGYSEKAKIAAMNSLGLGRDIQKAVLSGSKLSDQLGVMGVAEDVVKAKSLSLGAVLKSMFFGNPVSTLLTIASAVMTLIPVFDSLIETQEEVAEKAEEARTAIDDTQKAYNTLSQTVNDIKGEYAELRQGIGDFNENVSLSTDGYDRFLSLNNQLAELFPELVTGYDSNGNAILNLDGNVKSITSSLEHLVDVQRELSNQQILENADDVLAGVDQNITSQMSEYIKAEQLMRELNDNAANGLLSRLRSNGITGDGGKYFSIDTFATYLSEDSDKIQQILEDVLSEYDIFWDSISETYNESGGSVLEAAFSGDALKKLEDNYDSINSTFVAAVRNAYADAEKESHTYAEKIELEWKSLISILNSEFETDSRFASLGEINESYKSAISDILSSLSVMDNEWLRQAIGTGDFETLAAEIKDRIFKIFETESLTKEQKDAFANLLSLDPNSIPAEEYLETAQNVLSPILDFMAEEGIEIPLKFITEDSEEIYSAYQNRILDLFSGNEALASEFAKHLKGMGIDTFEKMDYFLSAIDGAEYGWQALQMYNEALEETSRSAENLKEVLNSASTDFETLNAALSESVSASGLSSDSISELESMFKELDGYDPAKLFERTATGIRLNSDEFRRLANQYDQANIEKYYDAVTAAYSDWQDAIATGADQEEINRLKDIYDNATLLASQYSGLTSAYQTWQNAQSAGESGDMYDSIQTAIERGKELLEQGLIGTDEFRAIADLFSFEDLSNASPMELMESFEKSLPVVEKYFTDGADGAARFVEEFGKLNEETGEWEANFNTQEIAEKLGMDVELVQAILYKLKDYGFEVWVDDTELIALPERIQKAEDAISSLREHGFGNDMQFDFDTSNLDSVDSQLEDAKDLLEEITTGDNALPLDSEEAQYALYIINLLLDRKHELAAPTIMNVDTTEADRGIAEGIEALQRYQTALDNLETARAIGTPEDVAEANKALDVAIRDVAELSPEIKLSLGIEETSIEGINAAISGLSDEAKLSELKLKINPVNDEVQNFLQSDTDKESKVIYTVDQRAVNSWVPPKKYGVAEYRTTISSTGATSKSAGDIPKLSARALALGGLTNFAYASGTIGAKRTETALTGELGPEMVVYGNRWWTVGDDHVEMSRIPKGAIVFNAAQTAEILKKGFTDLNGGRGIAYAYGTAYSGFSGNTNLPIFTNTHRGESGNNSSKSSSSSDKAARSAEAAADSAKNLFDWIQVLLDRAASATDRLFNKAELAIDSFRKKYFSDSALNSLAKELDYNQQAYERYMREANGVSLSESYKEKVRNGELDLETISDENLRNQIDSYQQMYENAMDCADAIDSLRSEIRNTAEDIANIPLDDLDSKLDDLSDSLTLMEKRYDNIVSLDDRNKLLQDQIANSESVWLASVKASHEIQQAIDSLKPSLINVAPDALISGSKIDTSSLTGQTLVNAEKYNAYLDAQKDILQQVSENLEDYTSALYENTKAQADNIQEATDNQLSILDSQIERYESQIELIEARGDSIGSEYYRAQIELYKEEADALKSTTDELQNFLDTQVEAGNIQKYSDDWYDLVNQIYENKTAIDEYTQSTIELQQAIDQIKLDNLERKLSVFDSLRDEASFLIDLLSNGDLIDSETGEYTADGITTAGLLAQQKEIASQAANEYKKYIQELDEQAAATGANIAGNSGYNQYMEARMEALAEYQSYIQEAYDAEQSQIDLVTERIEVQKEIYGDIIDARKEALETLRDEAEYAKDIEDKTKEKLLIERQLRALEGNDSDYAMKRRKELQQELDDINEDIKETEDDHEYDLKVDALEKDLEDFELFLDEYLKNSQKVISDLTTSVNENAGIVTDTLEKLSEDTGYTVSGTITNAWTTAGNSVAGYYEQITSVINSQSSMSELLQAISDSYNDIAISAEKAAESISEAIDAQNEMTSSAQRNPASNSVTSNREFVESLYREYFGREADAEGLNTWLSVLANGGTRDEVRQGFINSNEYQNPKYVRELYQELLGRTPTQSEVDFWVKRLNNGMSRDEVRQGFIGSEEYARKHGTQSSSAQSTPTKTEPTISENDKVSNLGYTLYKGLKNDDVKKLQKALNSIMDAGLEVDGSFGSATLEAVKKFQQANGLDPDGRVGPATREKFREAGFRRGGVVDVLRSTGEDGIALVRNGEMILTPDEGSIFKDFVANIPNLAQTMSVLDKLINVPGAYLHAPISSTGSAPIRLDVNSPLVEVHGDIDSRMANKLGKIVKDELTASLVTIRDKTKIKR